MSQPEKKRRSGRTAEPGAKSEKIATRRSAKRGAPIEHDPNPTLHTPWVPLIWLLVPLIMAVIYGISTR